MMPYLVIRDKATDELRVSRIVAGYRPPSDPSFTWGGPFRLRKDAEKAVADKSHILERQLYPERH